MKGVTKLIDYNDSLINDYSEPIDLPVGEIIEMESAPEGKPILTKYRIVNKEIRISITGTVLFIYKVNQLNDGIEQKYFI